MGSPISRYLRELLRVFPSWVEPGLAWRVARRAARRPPERPQKTQDQPVHAPVTGLKRGFYGRFRGGLFRRGEFRAVSGSAFGGQIGGSRRGRESEPQSATNALAFSGNISKRLISSPPRGTRYGASAALIRMSWCAGRPGWTCHATPSRFFEQYAGDGQEICERRAGVAAKR